MGHRVAFTYSKSNAKTETLVAELATEGGEAFALQADATDADALVRAVDAAAARFGQIDILVNNAGVLHWAPLDYVTLADFDNSFAVNVRAVFIAAQAAVRHMPNGGRIINIGSSVTDRVPNIGGGVYAMSKSALVDLTRGFARDLGPRNITINNIQPGPTDTDMNPAAGAQAKGLHDIMAVGRHARPEEIAGMVAYLAGQEAGMVTGANMLIDGGYAA